MSKKDISVTICIIGGIDTDSIKRAMDDFRPGMRSNLPDLASVSETALYIIKGGAQRWKTLKYPKMDTFILVDLYYMMPETIAALHRSIWEAE